MEKIKTIYVDESKWESIKNKLPKQNLLKRKEIYISDSPKVLKELKEKNIPLAVLFTEENSKSELSFVRFGLYNLEDMDEKYAEKIYMRNYGIPIEIRKEEGIIIREISIGDTEKIRQLYSEKSAVCLESFFETSEELEVYIKDYIENVYDFYGYGLWAICLEETKEFVGIGGFSAREDGYTLELGFAVMEKFQNRGYATKACQIMLRHAKEEIEYVKVIAQTHDNNKKARRVLKKVGFVQRDDGLYYL